MPRVALLITTIALLVASGCAQHPSAPATQPVAMGNVTVSNLDACADRLHELSGLLLQYYGIHGELPPKLADAAAMSPNGAELLACPASGKPYVYDPQGPLVTAGGSARIVVYDATPVHKGMRWGIVVAEPTPGKPLSAEVKAVPESAINHPAK